MQGTALGGFSGGGKEVLVSFPYGGLRKGKARLAVRIEKGELVGEVQGRKGVVRGAAFAGVELRGYLDTGARLELALPFRIKSAVLEDTAKYEPPTLPPEARGGTWLYALEYLDPAKGWKPACTKDADGRAVAIPVAALWTQNGKRSESTKRFTLACTSAVIAKCYRWGYRPWFEADRVDPNLFRRAHWTCTRMARADYCGDGIPHTVNQTPIYEWDNLVPQIAPPLEQVPTTMSFESGWSNCGAVCLSHFRWQNRPPVCNNQTSCLYRIVAGAAGGVPQPNVCNTPAEAANMTDPLGRNLRLFNLSNVNTPQKPQQLHK
jgi:hypothetical protein